MGLPVVPLSDIADVVAGNPAPQNPEDFIDEGIPFIRMQDVGRYHHCSDLVDAVDHVTLESAERNRLRLFPEGSLLVPKSGASVNLNHRAMLAREAYVVSHLAVAIPDTRKITPDYLYYWSLQYDPRSQAQVTSLPSLPLRLIKEAMVPLPSMEEQRRIVDILKGADGIRRLRKQGQEIARQLIPALFIDMFGNPETNPKEWQVVQLGQLISSGPQNGLYKPASAYGGGTPILRIDGFYDGFVTDLSTLRRLHISGEEVGKYQLHEHDIVINRVNSPEYLGKSAIIKNLLEDTVFESNMMRFNVDDSQLDPRYLIFHLQLPAIKSQILSKAKHAINQSSINQGDVKSLELILPPIDLQKQFGVFTTSSG